MKKLLALSLALTLVGCATEPVPQVSKQVEYQCKSQCGFYDPRMSIMGSAMCMADCYRYNK